MRGLARETGGLPETEEERKGREQAEAWERYKQAQEAKRGGNSK